ncbi:MAG: hypothetical protein QNL03_10370, partial [Gammaproteobacteria bacterium]|nr:hypothetical protein [Gammaproteobacteria bacterium]
HRRFSSYVLGLFLPVLGRPISPVLKLITLKENENIEGQCPRQAIDPDERLISLWQLRRLEWKVR